MNSTSGDFQTSGVVLLAATFICAIFGAVIIAPMLSRQGVSSVVTSSGYSRTPSQYAEFYPEPRPDRSDDLPVRQTVQAASRPWNHDQQGFHEQEISLKSETSAIAEARQIFQHVASENRTAVQSRTFDNRPQPLPTDLPRVPGGSVYAPVTVHPVTVNVDGSMFDHQLKALEQRIEQVLSAQVSSQDARQSRNQKAQRRSTRDERLARRKMEQEDTSRTENELRTLSEELKSLIATVQSLETQTKANVNQTYRHHIAAEAAIDRRLSEWEFRLTERLKAQENAVRTVIAARPSAAVPPPRPAPIPAAAAPVPVPVPAPNPAPQRAEATVQSETWQSQPLTTIVAPPTQQKPIPEAPQPADFDDSGSAETTAKALEKPRQIKAKPVSTPATADNAPLETVETITLTTDPAPMPEIEIRRREIQPQPNADFPPQTELRELVPKPIQPLPNATNKNISPAPQMFHQEETSDTNSERSTSLSNPSFSTPNSDQLPRSISQQKARGSVQPVAFESVYRFTMSDDAESVVPVKGTCPGCGRSDCPGHQPPVQAASLKQQPVQTRKQTQEQSSKPEKPRDGRGTLLPKIKIPSFTSRSDEPGVLHRISSSIRKITDRTVD